MTTPTYSPTRLIVALLLLLVTVRWVHALGSNVTPTKREQVQFVSACHQHRIPCAP